MLIVHRRKNIKYNEKAHIRNKTSNFLAVL